MFAKERQDKIYEAVIKNGAVETAGIVKALGVSIETVRRDLLFMEQQNLLKRVHGGAVRLGDMRTFPSLEARNNSNTKEKTSLARRAMDFISDGDFIAVDCGSTANFFAEVLKECKTNLTVLTHSADILDILKPSPSIEVILIGGQYMKKENAFYGTFALDMLSQVHVQKSFIFPSAISLKNGICDFQPDLYAIQKKMLEIGDEIFVLADSSKFEERAMLKIDEMRPEYKYITDGALPDPIIKLYSENNINVYKGESI